MLEARRSLAVTALAVWLLGAGAVRGQEADTAATPAPQPEATPGPIPAAEVPEAADRTSAELRRMEAALAPQEVVETVAAALSAKAPEIRQMREVLDRLDPAQLSTRYLGDLRLAWTRVADDLDRWRARLDVRWKSLQEIHDELDRRQARWRLTRTAASQEAFPPELVSRLDSIDAELDRVQRSVRRRSDAVARVIDRLSEERGVTRVALDRLDEYAAEARSRLLERDDVPIWRLGERAKAEGLSGEARAAQRHWLKTLEDWMGDSVGRLLLLAALLVGFCATTLGLRRRSAGWAADDPSRQAALHVVSRPFSAGLAFALALWVLAVGVLPSPVNDILGLLVVVPALRLGLGLVPPGLRWALVGVVALDVLARVWSLSPDGSLLRRLLLLGGALAGLAGARVVLRRWRRASSGGWATAVRWGLELAGALLALSVAANLLGFVNLAHVLGDGTIRSAFSAVAWLVVARAAQGLLPLMRSGGAVRRFPLLERQGTRLEALGRGAITLAALLLWGWGTLTRFELLELGAGWAARVLAASIRLGGLEISVGAVLAAAAVLALTFPLSRGVRIALQDEVLPRMQLPAGADHSVLTLVNYALFGVGLLLAASAAGLGSTQLALGFGALGVGIGFGLQNVVSNFASGLILIFERPIKVGDRVETATHLGVVTRIGIRSSTVRTFDGAEVVLPNADLVSKEVINWTLSDQVRRVDIRVGVAYGSDPHRVLELLRQVAKDQEGVLPEPEPLAVMVGFGDSSLDFRLLAWVGVESFLELSSRLTVAVHDALKAAEIEIPFPQRDLHLRSVDAPAAAGLTGKPPDTEAV